MKSAKIVLFAAALIAAFLTGIWYNERNSNDTPSASSERKILHYCCPMHPQFISDKPGDCPSCGMRLVPANTANDSAETGSDTGGDGTSTETIYISPTRQQMIGVSTIAVSSSGGANILRTVGRVATDETRVYTINATVDGWITGTRPSTTGSLVKKGEVLATFYSPEFLSGVQALLFALNSADRVQVTGKENPGQKDQLVQFAVNLQQYKDSLRNLGMGELQLQDLVKTRKWMENVDITSPADGFILTRKISLGLRFNKGDEMYRIADLSRVWILVDVFENEERYLRPGNHVRVTLPNQGTTVDALVTNVLPQFDPATRTLKIRLAADNPGFRLRPDQFVDVELPVNYSPALTVPSEAVLDTGLRKIVFVDRGNGHFEPRHVETGWRMNNRVEIVKGLMEGERIVVSGNFLIDSEARMRSAAMGLRVNAAEDPVCGMKVDPAKAGENRSSYGGVIYYFCSGMCKQKFDKSPALYIQRHDRGDMVDMRSFTKRTNGSSETAGLDPVCGMDVDITRARAAGRISEYRGSTYHFCADECKRKFDMNPEQYLGRHSPHSSS